MPKRRSTHCYVDGYPSNHVVCGGTATTWNVNTVTLVEPCDCPCHVAGTELAAEVDPIRQMKGLA